MVDLNCCCADMGLHLSLQVREKEADIDALISPIEDMYALLLRYEVRRTACTRPALPDPSPPMYLYCSMTLHAADISRGFDKMIARCTNCAIRLQELRRTLTVLMTSNAIVCVTAAGPCAQGGDVHGQ